MTDEPNEPDELDELLAPPPAVETPDLRGAILQATQCRLALARWTRRAVKVAAVAAVFAVGVGVGVWGIPRERETVLVPTPAPPGETVTVPVPVFVLLPGAPAERRLSRDPARTAKALELDAEQTDDALAAAKIYRQAGDAYLNAEQDYANAARCYRIFLTRGGDTALSPETGDSWLLTSLKNAAFKEKVNATPAHN